MLTGWLPGRQNLRGPLFFTWAQAGLSKSKRLSEKQVEIRMAQAREGAKAFDYGSGFGSLGCRASDEARLQKESAGGALPRG